MYTPTPYSPTTRPFNPRETTLSSPRFPIKHLSPFDLLDLRRTPDLHKLSSPPASTHLPSPSASIPRNPPGHCHPAADNANTLGSRCNRDPQSNTQCPRISLHPVAGLVKRLGSVLLFRGNQGQ